MSKAENCSIAAVVVTYNRKELLRKCLQALLSQNRPLDDIIVIDNASTDGTEQMVRDEFSQITYVRLPENIGGAGGFYEGMKLAYEKGHDWIWLMDDDVEVGLQSLEVQLEITKKYDLMVSGALVIDSSDTSKLAGAFHDPVSKKVLYKLDDIKPYGEIIRDYSFFFNGILINKKVIDQIGFPKKEFFIWGDEVDYRLRIIKQGFSISTVLNAIIYHPRFPPKQARLGWIGPYIIATKGVSLYCMIRNYIIIRKEYNGLTTALFFAVKQIIKYLLFSIQKLDLEYFKIALLAAMDGMTNTFGKEKFFLNR